MIKNYKQFNESLKDKLVGPTEDEVLDNLKLRPNDLLLKSCKIGFLKGVEIALNRGADVHIHGDYPLKYASVNGHIEIVKYLLNNGADVHIDNDLPLKRATKMGHTETSELIKKYMEKE